MGHVRVGDDELYEEVEGAGEPVLLLHGGFCSLESLRIPGEALAVDHRVHAFERPGHGRSADHDELFTYERSLAETVGYLDAVGLGSVHVVGYSDGGIIGLLLAMRHPERVRSLVAISANLDPSAFTDGAEAAGEPVLTGEPRARHIECGTGAADRSGADDERAHYDRLSPDGAGHADVVLEKLVRMWTSEPHIDPAELAVIGAPTLVVSGDRDAIRPGHSLRIAAAIPGAQLCIVPGTTHALVAERPRLVGALVRDFVAAVERDEATVGGAVVERDEATPHDAAVERDEATVGGAVVERDEATPHEVAVERQRAAEPDAAREADTRP
nr:alpha/beta hydrolase [Pseudoclavibacter chungangensis]